MRAARILVVGVTIASAILIASTERRTRAQPADGGEIEMGDTGSGSGSAAGSAAPTTPKPIVKDPKAAKKAFAAAQAAAAKADAFIKKGKAEEAKAQYEAALTLFVSATDLGDDVNYYFYLAGTEDKLGKFVDAVKHYRMVLRAQSGVQANIAKVINAKLEEEMGKIGTVTLTVTPDGATVMLAGETLGVSPLPEPLVMLPGTYTFSLNAPGYQPKETEVTVEAGSESERKIELESVQIIIEKPRKVIGEEVDEAPKKKGANWIPVIIGGGVTIGLATTSIIAGVLAQKQHDTFVAPETTKTGRSDAKQVGTDYAHLSDACLGGTVVAAAFTAYWYWFQVRPKLHEANTPDASDRKTKSDVSKVDVVPWVQPDSSGLTVFGRF